MFDILNKEDIIKKGVITTEIGRFYKNGDIWCPSVTTVSKLKSDKVYDESNRYFANRGSAMHAMIEEYILSEIENEKQRVLNAIKKAKKRDELIYENVTEEEFDVGRRLFIKLWENDMLKWLHNYIAVEQQIKQRFIRDGVVYGYAGRLDYIGNIQNKIKVVDFKSSFFTKSKEGMEIYELQLPAYIIPYRQQNNVDCVGEFWVVCEKGNVEIQVFSLLEQELIDNYKKFEDLVVMYYEKNHKLIEFINKELNG